MGKRISHYFSSEFRIGQIRSFEKIPLRMKFSLIVMHSIGLAFSFSVAAPNDGFNILSLDGTYKRGDLIFRVFKAITIVYY